MDLRQALDQATEYAKLFDVPIVFAMNGAYCEAHFVANNKELIKRWWSKGITTWKRIISFVRSKQ